MLIIIPQQAGQGATQAQSSPRVTYVPGEAVNTGESYGVLKAREKELKNQLEDVQERRNDLAQQADRNGGPEQAGLQSRIAVLDQRLANMENDLALVGRQLAATAPVSIAAPPPQIVHEGYNDDDMLAAGFGGAGIMLVVLLPIYLYRRLRRVGRTSASAPQPVFAAERVERMEQAIDTIAIEMERVSENQRFMTRLMTETQLAGTIAAVRGSAEAAKAAAEEASHAR